LNYYERYCGDYQRDTAHLSLAEHGAYTMLLDAYFSMEKPLPKDLPSLYRVCRAMTRVEQQAVKAVVEQFFPVSEMDGLRHNQRADREIAKARPKIEAARINGRKGGRPAKAIPQGSLPEALPSGLTPVKTQHIPEGLSLGIHGMASGISPAINRETPDEAGGKALQHQHQHQHQCHKSTEQGILSDIMADRAIPSFADIEMNPRSFETKSERSVQPGTSGTFCQALQQLGIAGCNPHHPTFLALLKAGATEVEFLEAAKSALARGKTSFAYVVGTVKRQREEAAKLVLYHGRMPNRQELLESSNAVAAECWLPPELREQGDERKSREGQDANG
jgi:uncharacterized protein YdaU (DUF1376 family)